MSLPSFFNLREPHIRRHANLPHTSSGVTVLTGGATPMPTETSLTPAWDPSSRTPLGLDHCLSPAHVDPSKENQASQSSSALVNPPAPEHVLINPLLVGAIVKATVTGGEYKNQLLDVAILNVDGRIRLFHPRFTRYLPLEPHWVTPKNPSATNDHGLLIVIQGEHCGKYVRRLAHIVISGEVMLILAVVQHAPKSTDILTGERLQLAPDLLCKSVESDSDRKLNKNVMTTVRKQFRS